MFLLVNKFKMIEMLCSVGATHKISPNREEKLLHHVAMVTKFLDDNKPKRHLKKLNSHCFKLHRSYLISFNLSNVSEIFRVKSERTVCKFRKRKTKFLFCCHLLHKAGA